MHHQSTEAPRLDAIYVSFDGLLKAVYQDNTVLVMSAHSSSFTHVSPAGIKTTQLCEFCLSRFAPLLIELLEFRNQHMDVPTVCRPLLQQLERNKQLFTLHYPILYVCWPSTAEEAFQQNLVELPDSSRIAVFSRCGSARIVLEYTGLRFAVHYPLLVAYHPASNSYTYTWQTQVYSRNQYPHRWQAALAVATSVADNAAHGFKLQQQHWQPRLTDITVPSAQQQQQQQPGSPSALVRCSTVCSCSPVRHGSPARTADHCGSPQRYGSPLQRQHRGWQQQEWQSPTVSSPAAAAAAAGTALRASGAWSAFGSPTRMSQQQQQQQQQFFLQESPPASAAVVVSSSMCISQLPITANLLQRVPAYVVPQSQGPTQQQQQQQPPGSSSSSSRIAAALAQTLGHRQGLGAAAASAAAAAAGGLGRGWWLEPSLLLPSDDLLQMVWTREATMIFVQGVAEVEVWLHADDSCLYSFQSGAFITHLMPRLAAASWDTKAAAAAAAGASAGDILSGAPMQGVSTPSTWCEAATAAATSTACYTAQETPEAQLGMQLQHLRVPATAAAAGSGGGTAAAGHAVAEPALGLVDGTIDASEMSRVYAASALPEMPVAAVATVAESGSRSCDSCAGGLAGLLAPRLPVGQVAARALKFRNTMVRVQRLVLGSSSAAASQLAGSPTDSRTNIAGNQQQPACNSITLRHKQQQQQLQHQASDSSQQQNPARQLPSTQIIEDQYVPGVVRFTATADGRVRALFEDRTILNLAADGAAASLLLPDGTRRQVAAGKPVGVEDYVHAAKEFSTWASTTPTQRAAALRMQALVAAELRSSARMAAICEWAAGQRIPAAVATHAAAAQQDSAATAEAAAEAELGAVDPGCDGYIYDVLQVSTPNTDVASPWQQSSSACVGRAWTVQQDVRQELLNSADSWSGRIGKQGSPVQKHTAASRYECGAALTTTSNHSSLGGMAGVAGGVQPYAVDAVARQRVVEDMLQANARLLQRLAS